MISYLSMLMAMRLKTLADMDKMATKLLILQYASPYGQTSNTMDEKLNMIFNVDTMASAMDKLTRK